MEFRVLGSVEVVQNGNGSIQLGGPKQRAVLAHLLLRANHLVPTEVLIDEVWGEAPPETARNAVQSYASHLRKALGPNRLEGSRAGYRLLVEPSELDAATFQSLLRDARRLLPIDARAAVGAFDRALDLWRGPAFADLAAESSLQAEAARLEDLRLGALEDRIEAQLTIGQHAEVIGELERLTTRYPLRERFWEQLMLALYRSGRQGEALGAYRRVLEILADELGVDPSPELRRLHERILAHDPDLEPGGEPLRGYRLLERIGGDSLGSLYRATQPNVGRDVALRVVHEHRANDPAFVRRFQPDAQAVAALEHPHVAPIYDYWREPGRACLVSRYLRGGSLAQLLNGTEPVEGERATRILEQIASALAAAHRRGVAHGDLRASNVLFDDEGNAFLTDFSIGLPPEATLDDLTAFANLARDTFGGRVPMSFGELLRAAESGRRSGNEAQPFNDIAASMGSSAGQARTVSTEVRNPYKGLRPFLEADAGDFFGREAFIARLVERMSARDGEPRFVAVVGPSGSGKSSVVRAGLVSAIRAGAVPGSQDWLVTEMHPGHHPFEELDDALMRVAVHPPAGLLAVLESGPRGLVEAADAIAPDDADLVLIVDQFEETFTLTENEDERALLMESLRVAAVDPDSRVRVIVTLRADFYDRPLRYPRMGPLLGSTTEVLSPLTPEELERAIVQPAEGSGQGVESALVPQIAADVTEQPGGLPLLEYALTELFDRRDDGRLTLQAYREIGGVGGALASSAEHLYATRHETGRDAVRQLFLRLVTLGEGTADTRRRVSLSEFSSIEIDASAMDAAIETYGRHRLLTFDRDPATREPTVEIAHEALLDAWERLRGWIDEAREDLRMSRRLSDAAREWERNDRDTSFLLSGSRLDQFNGWEASTNLALRLSERAYLSASLARRWEERTRERERQDREGTLERRSLKRLRALAAALTVGVLVAGGLTAIAIDRNAKAQRATRLVIARGLATAALGNLEVDRELAVLLALESIRANQGNAVPQAEETLRRAGTAVAIDTRSVLDQGVHNAWINRAGETISVVGGDGSVGVWDLRDGHRRFTDGSAEKCGSTGCPGVWASVSEDGSILQTQDGDGVHHVWDIGRAREVLTVAPKTQGDQTNSDLSPDGSLFATIDPGLVRLYAVETGQLMWRRSEEWLASPWTFLAFSPDGSKLLVGSAIPDIDAAIGLIDVATGESRILSPRGVNAVGGSFNADGSRLAVLTEEPQPRLTIWAVPSGAVVATTASVSLGATATASTGDYLVALSPDGAVIALSGGETQLDDPNVVNIIDSETFDSIRLLRGHTTPVKDGVFDQSGERIATRSLDGTVNVWDADTGGLLFTPPSESSKPMRIWFSEDGSRLIVVYEDGRILVYPIALSDAIEIARSRVTRSLTPEECQRYHVTSCSPGS
jgi:DNA-binding SARP family transcriptional activator/WD40 repeat protein